MNSKQKLLKYKYKVHPNIFYINCKLKKLQISLYSKKLIITKSSRTIIYIIHFKKSKDRINIIF